MHAVEVVFSLKVLSPQFYLSVFSRYTYSSLCRQLYATVLRLSMHYLEHYLGFGVCVCVCVCGGGGGGGGGGGE